MPDDPAVEPAAPRPAAPEPADVARAHHHADELAQRLARLADDIADSEEKVARTYEESARLRPHDADRLHSGAEEARRFAQREREYARDLLDSREPPDG